MDQRKVVPMAIEPDEDAQLNELAQIVDKIHEVTGDNLTIEIVESKVDLNAVLEVAELEEMVKGTFRPRC
ncbi:hypothetical protein NPIL_169121 [Nephila pilipes]|uniref:Uncharacterized protein n=1 Tax=Nephila pilipes TaxID=299642 RepID=A0A8X6Q1H8_NEPPI|nr:hypothetical protein NPIL_169121 [Nephila pilipes]